MCVLISPGEKSAPGSRSLSEIIASIQKSKLGIEGWTLGDLTIGLYLIYLRQASLSPFEDVKGVQVVSESTVRKKKYIILLKITISLLPKLLSNSLFCRFLISYTTRS